MSSIDIEEFLQSHSIKPTPNRVLIVKAMAEAGRPLSMKELEDVIESVDKSNIFRALNLFSERHLIHMVEDGGSGERFELSIGHHYDHHPHFYCEKCHRTYCLDEHIQEVSVPDGYEVTSVNYLIRGVCPECSRKK